MKKRLFAVIALIAGGVGLWMFFGISRVVQAERDVVARFDELAGYYATLDEEYVSHLTGNTDLQAGDRAALLSLEQSLRALPVMPGRNERYEALRKVQKDTIAFFGTPNLPESLVLDARYQAWNKHASNYGQASAHLKNYNDALGLYNSRLDSSAGKLVSLWRRWGHHRYLGIDGSLEDTPQVSF
jgi:hypothetical protein